MSSGANKPFKSDLCSKLTWGSFNPETGTFRHRVCGKCKKCRKRAASEDRAFNLALMLSKNPAPYGAPLVTYSPVSNRCTQSVGCKCVKCERFRVELAREIAEEQAAIARFKEGIYAACGHFPGKEELTDGPENGADLVVCRPIESVSQLLSKTAAEQDDHPRSKDWALAPAGTMELYLSLATLGQQALSSGLKIARVKVPECGPEQIRWLTEGNDCPLVTTDGEGYVTLLRDPEARESPEYPGCPEGVNPKAGKTFGEMLPRLIAWIRASQWGASLSITDLTRTINSAKARAEFGLEEYRYAGYDAVRHAHAEMVKDGRLKRVKSAVHYRVRHRWAVESNAVYDPHFTLSPEDELTVTACVREALTAKMEEIRERLQEDRQVLAFR